MKIALFCFLLVCSAVHGQDDSDKQPQIKLDPTKYLLQIVNRQKKSVETITNNMRVFEKKIYENAAVQMNNIRAEGMLAGEQIAFTALDTMQKEVAKKPNGGAKTEACYNDVKNWIHVITLNSNEGLATCGQAAMAPVNPHFENIHYTILTAQQMVVDLDAIVPNCYSASFIKMNTCVIGKTILTRSAVNELRSASISVKSSASKALSAAVSSAKSCSTTVVSDTRIAAMEAMLKGITCIRNV